MGRSKQSASKGTKTKSPSKATKTNDVKSETEQTSTSKSPWMMLGIGLAILAAIMAAAIPHFSGLDLAGMSSSSSSPEFAASRKLEQESVPVSSDKSSKAEKVAMEEKDVPKEEESETAPIEPEQPQEEEPEEAVVEEESTPEEPVPEEHMPEEPVPEEPVPEEPVPEEHMPDEHMPDEHMPEEEAMEDSESSDGAVEEDSDKEEIDTERLLIRDVGTYELSVPTMDPTVNRTVTMKSVSSRPRVFVIEDYLTDEECDMIIEKSASDMEPSDTSAIRRKPSLHDVNQDGFIDLAEMRLTVGAMTDIHLTEEELLEYYDSVEGLDLGFDNLITKEHMQYLNPMDMAEYAQKIAEEKPMRRGRYAEHAWLRVDEGEVNDVVRMLEKRVGIVLGMDEDLVIQTGESMLQVVKYDSHGHYNTHYDSSERLEEHMKPPDAHQTWGMCCHVTRRLHVDGKNLPNCRSCRFATLIYYLQTPDTGGGETVFPFVDNEDFSELKWRTSPEGDPSHYCSADKSDSLLLAPKRGRAVVFFNHLPSNESGFAYGPIDRSSLHASCPIHEGNTVPKIMANHWIELSDRLSDENIKPGDDLSSI